MQIYRVPTPPTDFRVVLHGLRRIRGVWRTVDGLEAADRRLPDSLCSITESFGDRVVPRVSLTYLLWRAEMAAGRNPRCGQLLRGIKEPSFEEIVWHRRNLRDISNPGLKPEEARALEAGVEQSFGSHGRGSLSALYFNNLFTNQIEYNIISGLYHQYINQNQVLAHGAELDLTRQDQPKHLRSGLLYIHLDPDFGSAAGWKRRHVTVRFHTASETPRHLLTAYTGHARS